MPPSQLIMLTVLALLAFAGNSLLCRAALAHTAIDPASFTTVRLLAGALVLWLIARARSAAPVTGSWRAAASLFLYASCFCFAYLGLTAATGALLLFGAVQSTMIGYGLWAGERVKPLQVAGLVAALTGLVVLLLPGLAAPPLGEAALMLGAGIAWGLYSLGGRGPGDPIAATAGNFLRAVPLALVVSLAWHRHWGVDSVGLLCAIASGALTSGIGYAIWYAALPHLSATKAATLQLLVPVLTALAGMVLLGESLSLRWVLSSAAVMLGVALVIVDKRSAAGG